MIDFVISGSRGFIGKHLIERLHAARFSVMSDREFANKQQLAAGTFVNCANIAGSPSENLALLEDKVSLAEGRCERFVQLLSFSTLHGNGRFSLAELNCGLRPAVMNLYSAGKFEQERALLRHAVRGFVPSVLLAYLPVVLGEGGAWSAALEQSRRHGFRLPHPMSRAARANWIELSDIERFLIAAHREAVSSGVRRAIVNRPEAEMTTWPDLLGGAELEPVQENAKAILKERAVDVVLRAVAIASRAGVLVPMDRVLRKVLAGKHGKADEAAIPASPLVFRSVMKTIAAQQPFIPASELRGARSPDVAPDMMHELSVPLVPAQAGTQSFGQKAGFPLSRE